MKSVAYLQYAVGTLDDCLWTTLKELIPKLYMAQLPLVFIMSDFLRTFS